MPHSPIFISYSHRDGEWLSELLRHLAVLQAEGLVDAWSDENLRPGDDWPQEIRSALDRAHIAILLVSTNFLTSRFIMEKELPALLEREEAGKLKKILPLVVTPCAWQLNRYLKGIEKRPKQRDSLASGDAVQIASDLADFTVEVSQLLDEPMPVTFEKREISEPERPEDRDAVAPPRESDYAILEIGLRHREWDRYSVDLKLTHSADSTPPPRQTHLASMDLPRLAAMRDPGLLAAELRRILFPEPCHHEIVAAARKCAQELGVPLRLRVAIGPCARELHWLRWEVLTHGVREENDLSFETTCLVRYAGAENQRRRNIQHRPKGRLTALLVAGLTDWFDSSIPPAGAPDPAQVDLGRAAEILKEAGAEVLEVKGYLNPEALRATLRAREPDILYCCMDVREIPVVDDRERAGFEQWPIRLAGQPMADALKGLDSPPRMVVLSPVLRSELPDTAAAQPGWLPILREAYELTQGDVIGVLTAQDHLEPSIWQDFLAAFFKALDLNGRMDFAIRSARSTIQHSGRQWVPVLIASLRTARIWYIPRFTEETRTEPTWKTLLAKIRSGVCTPILGPGLNITVARHRSDIAQSWAEEYRYPMSVHERESLPQVAQYVASVYGEDFFYVQYEARLREFTLQRYGHLIPQAQHRLPLDLLLSKVASTVLERDPDEPHNILAALPFRLYVTASLNSFLSDALKRVPEKEPQEVVLGLASPPGAAIEVEPSPERPLVYHLFGTLGDIGNSVITEDDYFRFLIHFWKERETVPKLVRAALSDSSLLFLGFKMHHWDFRVLFRTLLAQEGAKRLRRHTHVAVQVDPDDDQVMDPERARSYLENYFSEFTDADINVFWGSAQDFLLELKRHWVSTGG
jgi:hypothetical protein